MKRAFPGGTKSVRTWGQTHASGVLKAGQDVEDPPVRLPLGHLSGSVVLVGLYHLLQLLRNDTRVVNGG